MEVRMEHTEGLGKLAEVWADGRLLQVCDGVSAPGRRVPAGVMKNVEFRYVTMAGFSWPQAVRGNPDRKKDIAPVRRWSYVGYGQVLSVMPVVIDFGLLRMEDANWTTDEGLVGQYVRVPIDRLEIVPSREPDWPEDAR